MMDLCIKNKISLYKMKKSYNKFEIKPEIIYDATIFNKEKSQND